MQTSTSSAAASPWAALLPAALAGTRRQPFAPLPGLTPPLGTEAASVEKQLLLTAANLRVVQRAGSQPQSGPAESLGRAGTDTMLVLSPASARILLEILSDQRLEVLEAGCLQQIITARQRLSPRALADFRLALPHARRDYLLRWAPHVVGRRGEWLAAIRYRRPLVPPPAPARPPLHPHHDLPQLLAQRPPGGWEWLLTELQADNARQNYDLAHVLRHWHQQEPVPAVFAPVLEKLLPAWHSLVADSLASIPGNALVARNWDRARPHLTYSPEKALLRVTLPVWHESWQLDQVERQGQYTQHLTEQEYPLHSLLSWIPPSHWLDAWGVSATEAVALAAASRRAATVLSGWLAAARRFHDLPMLRTLLAHAAQHPRLLDGALPYPGVADFINLLPENERASWLFSQLPELPLTTVEGSTDRVFWVQYCAPTVLPALLPMLQPYLRRWLELPVTFRSKQLEEQFSNLLAHTLAPTADLTLLPWLEAELLPLARAQSQRPLALAVWRAHQLLSLRQELATSLSTPASTDC